MAVGKVSRQQIQVLNIGFLDQSADLFCFEESFCTPPHLRLPIEVIACGPLGIQVPQERFHAALSTGVGQVDTRSSFTDTTFDVIEGNYFHVSLRCMISWH